MKLHPPKAIIDTNDPFKEALFGRKEFAESLTSLLRNAEDNLVIFVHAPWGEGKTTFAEMWRGHLTNQKLDVIYFDAYAVDYFEDPFVSFSGEILALVDKHLSEKTGKPARREFKKTAVEVGKRLGGLATKIAIRAATMGVVKESDLDEVKEIGTEVATGVSEIGADIIEKKIENYTAEKDSLTEFKKSLAKLAKLFREEHGFPLTIIVDELDRCRPSFALSLLERIKHLFDVEGVAFVLLVNRDQIESYIRVVYGDVDPRAYLLKFGNLFVELPRRQSEYAFHYEDGRQEYAQRLTGHHGLSKLIRDQHLLSKSIGVFSDHFELTLREMEKAFTTLAIYYSSVSQDQSHGEMLVALASVLRLKQPGLYKALSKGQISASQFFMDSGLDQFNERRAQGFNWEWHKDALDFYLMTDAELAEATNDQRGNKAVRSGLVERMRWAGNRKNIIPSLCSQLDRFALRP